MEEGDQAELDGNLEVRQWVARELHDSVTSYLTTMLVEMEQLKRDDGKQGIREPVESLQDTTREVLRNFRRVLTQLRGESPEVAWFVDSLRNMLEKFQARTGINAVLAGVESWPSGLASRPAHELLGIVGEALQNVRIHSAARTVAVHLSCTGVEATLTITDDGVGHEAVDDRGGMGVVGMHERAAVIGGYLRILSAPGQGTTVQAVFPVARLMI